MRATTLNQRWGQRIPADAPKPTVADLNSEVFLVTVKHTDTGVEMPYSVLALDADHAAELVGIAIVLRLGNPFAAEVVKREQVTSQANQMARYEAIDRVLASEDPKLREARQEAYARRDRERRR